MATPDEIARRRAQAGQVAQPAPAPTNVRTTVPNMQGPTAGDLAGRAVARATAPRAAAAEASNREAFMNRVIASPEQVRAQRAAQAGGAADRFGDSFRGSRPPSKIAPIEDGSYKGPRTMPTFSGQYGERAPAVPTRRAVGATPTVGPIEDGSYKPGDGVGTPTDLNHQYSTPQREVTAEAGYQAQGLRGTRAPSEEDKRRLYHDLTGIGRGSPGIRAALLARFNDAHNNAEEGINQRAVTDLAAGARSDDAFADRKAGASEANARNALTGRQLDTNERESGAKINMYDELRKDAAARREDDKHDLLRRGMQDRDAEARIAARMEAEGLTREQAVAADAADTVNTVQDLKATTDVIGARANAQSVLDDISGDAPSWYSDAFEWRNPAVGNAVAPSVDDYDLGQLKGGRREVGWGVDAETVNYALPGFAELDEYQVEGAAPADQPGVQLRRTFRDADAFAEFESKRKLGVASQEAIRKRNREGRGE